MPEKIWSPKETERTKQNKNPLLYPKLKLELTKAKRREEHWGRKILPRRSMENQKPLASSKHLWVSTLCLEKVIIMLVAISYPLKLNRSFELGSYRHVN